jgi:very-short-patch-repair endonuclease
MAIRDYANAMRRFPTKSEARLWSWLRNRHFGDFKFRRQHPIAGYILDFYCPELKLAIEADGTQHETAWVNEYDSQRTIRLRKHGIHIVRLSNELIAKDPVIAAETIQLAVDRLKP